MTTRMAASNMELHALSTGREPRVATVTRALRQTLFRCWGGAKMILGRGSCGEGRAERRLDRRKGGASRSERPEEDGLRGAKRVAGRNAVGHGAPDHGKGRGSGAGAVSRRGGTSSPVRSTDRTHSAKRYRGYVGASLIVGGVDFTGPQLYCVHPHGSYSRLPFTAQGERFRPLPANPARGTSTFIPRLGGRG